jgi:hypothetical protein
MRLVSGGQRRGAARRTICPTLSALSQRDIIASAKARHSCSLISWASNAEVVYSLLNSLTVIACRVATPRTPCWLRRLIAKSQGCEDDADCKGHHWLSPRIVRHSRRLFESEDMFPIVLHADHYRAVFHCLIVKLLGKAFGDSDVS